MGTDANAAPEWNPKVNGYVTGDGSTLTFWRTKDGTETGDVIEARVFHLTHSMPVYEERTKVVNGERITEQVEVEPAKPFLFQMEFPTDGSNKPSTPYLCGTWTVDQESIMHVLPRLSANLPKP